jgi:hypothetical protein
VLEDPIRHTGEHNVSVHLVGRLRPQVTVIVTGEREEEVEASPTLEDATSAEPIAEE